ncbi:hypothetical protein FBU30_010428 [Linnemannia zychae]|nr:hypothetical protein FBU30_010428 [Linnemannia zychae]
MSSFSSISSTSSVPSNASISSFYQQQYQQRLVQRHIRRPHSNNGKSVLQFSTRAQAMGFLINLLQSFQQEPCECDLVQGCFCSPEGVEDHSGLAPCYVCGEWYAEEVFCRMDDSEEYTKVDGRSWHERGGASLRHQVAETRVRQWLNQVVVPIASAATFSSSTASFYHQQQQPQHQGQSHPNYKDQEEKSKVQRDQTQPTPAPTNVIRSRPGRSASCPATFSIPEEILDPSTRSPGFRIKRRDTISTECPVSLPSSPLVDQKPVLPTTSFSAPSSATSTLNHISGSTPFRFSFTSMRFNAAVQESLSRRSSITTISPPVDAVDTASAQELTPANNSNNSINNDHGNACANTTTESQTEALAEQTEAELGTEAETVTVARSETNNASNFIHT